MLLHNEVIHITTHLSVVEEVVQVVCKSVIMTPIAMNIINHARLITELLYAVHPSPIAGTMNTDGVMSTG